MLGISMVVAVAYVLLNLDRIRPRALGFGRHARRARALEAQVRANPANITAHRDLATYWLARRRPRRALAHTQHALARDPDEIELQYLAARCRLAARDHAPAAAALQAIAARDPAFRYGEPALRAGDALLALGRWSAAEAALDEFARRNLSSVEVRVKLARCRDQRGDHAGARALRGEARRTYRELPRFQQRAQRGWYLRAVTGF
jgi:tetratricopeptide (TPR) repeat protein